MSRVCGLGNCLVKTGRKTQNVHADHLIRAHDVPNETSELDISVPESCEQSSTVLGVSPVFNSVPHFQIERLALIKRM